MRTTAAFSAVGHLSVTFARLKGIMPADDLENQLRSRTHEWCDPREIADAANTLSGLEFLQTLQRANRPPPIMSTLDMQIVAVNSGEATFAFTPAEFHYNPIGSVHGGVIATILDSAMGCAIHTMLPAGDRYTTTDINVRFIRAVAHDSGPLTCVGTVVNISRRLGTSEARLRDAAGRLYAYASCNCLITRANA